MSCPVTFLLVRRLLDLLRLGPSPDEKDVEILDEFVAHYNYKRPHRGIDLGTPVAYTTLQRSTAVLDRVERTDRLGGLLREYSMQPDTATNDIRGPRRYMGDRGVAMRPLVRTSH